MRAVMLEQDRDVAQKHQQDYLSRLLQMKELIEAQASKYHNTRLSFELLVPIELDPSSVSDNDNDISALARPETIEVCFDSALDKDLYSIRFPNGITLSWQSFMYFIELLQDMGGYLIDLEQCLCQYE